MQLSSSQSFLQYYIYAKTRVFSRISCKTAAELDVILEYWKIVIIYCLFLLLLFIINISDKTNYIKH
jgi:hypothetical protein